jgi:uncharacterized membrane protein
MNEYLLLVFACVSFVGTHFLMSHSWRAAMVRRLGANGFLLAYSAISLALFVWMVIEFGRAPKAEMFWPVGDIIWAVASVITLLAAILFAGSFVKNPSLPGMPDAMAAQMPSGVFRVTRHPMMWGFALWAMAHILVAPRNDNFIFSGSILFLALAGARAQEIKKLKMTGVVWEAWLRRTSFALQLTALPRVGAGPWVAGIAIWLLATWSHPFWGVGGAGIFRWLEL